MTNSGDPLLRLSSLVNYPQENLSVEYKAWLDLSQPTERANLAKDLLALANYGGGYLVFGFNESISGLDPAGNNPYDIERYSQDGINAIVLKHADPSFQCGVFNLRSDAGFEHTVVEVPGGHKVPIRSKRAPVGSDLRSDTYYSRQTGPASAPVSGGLDWDRLISACVRNNEVSSTQHLLEALQTIRANPELVRLVQPQPDSLDVWEASSRERLAERISLLDEPRSEIVQGAYALGSWNCIYSLEDLGSPIDINSLRDLIREVKGSETGWPPFLSFDQHTPTRPSNVSGIVECSLLDTEQMDFWRASPRGELFLARRLQEDYDFRRVTPGTAFDLSLPAWRIGECLLHCARLAGRLNISRARVRFSWYGLRGRVLIALSEPQRHLSIGRQCESTEVRVELEIDTTVVQETLVELIRQFSLPLYSAFDFFTPPLEFYGTTVRRLLGR